MPSTPFGDRGLIVICYLRRVVVCWIGLVVSEAAVMTEIYPVIVQQCMSFSELFSRDAIRWTGVR